MGRSRRALEDWLDRVAYVLGLPVAWVLRLFRLRILGMSGPSVIGHFAAETDYFLGRLRDGAWGDIRPVLPMRRYKKPNTALLAKLARHVTLVRHPVAVSLCRAFEPYPWLGIDLREVVRTPASCPYYRYRAETAARAPTIVMDAADDERAREALASLGVPEGRWLAALHVREGSYDGGRFDQRNAELSTYLGAVEEIVARGGWCLRMGDRAMSPAPEVAGLVDYARSAAKSDFMDVYLIARARIFVGSSSGLLFVAIAAGTPVVSANMMPFGASLLPEPGSLSIPKLLRDRTGRHLRFAEMATHPTAYDMQALSIGDHALSYVDSDRKSIRALVTEALDRLDARDAGEPGPAPDAEDEDRQQAFRRLLTPRHYCYSAAGRIGTAFLRRYQHLL